MNMALERACAQLRAEAAANAASNPVETEAACEGVQRIRDREAKRAAMLEELRSLPQGRLEERLQICGLKAVYEFAARNEGGLHSALSEGAAALAENRRRLLCRQSGAA